jgi:hypothetical protein
VNLQALYQLKHENPQAITRLAEEKGLDQVVSMGVALLLLANDGNLASLSLKQKEHFDETIKPLIE